jgi:hypothetical protein
MTQSGAARRTAYSRGIFAIFTERINSGRQLDLPESVCRAAALQYPRAYSGFPDRSSAAPEPKNPFNRFGLCFNAA